MWLVKYAFFFPSAIGFICLDMFRLAYSAFQNKCIMKMLLLKELLNKSFLWLQNGLSHVQTCINSLSGFFCNFFFHDTNFLIVNLSAFYACKNMNLTEDLGILRRRSFSGIEIIFSEAKF